MARRFTTVSTLKGLFVAGLLAFAGPALAAPSAHGPNKHSQAKTGHSSKAPQVLVVTTAPKGKAKQRDRVTVVSAPRGRAKQQVKVVVAPRVVLRGEPRVTVRYTPQVVYAAPRPVQERPSVALRLRLERAQATGRLSNRELRKLVVALQRVEAAERRFLRGDRRLGRRELRTLARLEANFVQSFQQAMRGRA